MTDKEILQKAIEIVSPRGLFLNKNMSVDTFKTRIIFSHEFAKAFWGEKDNCVDIQIYSHLNKACIYRWQYHLSKMVLEKEPLKYLEKFL